MRIPVVTPWCWFPREPGYCTRKGCLLKVKNRDQFGHRKLGGIGDKIADQLKELSPQFNNGKRVNIVNQRLGYLVRCGEPDAIDSIVPMAFGNLALDLILSGSSGRLVCLRNGCYDNVPIESIMGRKKVVDIDKYYDFERLRPKLRYL